LLKEISPVAYNPLKKLHILVLFNPPWNILARCGTLLKHSTLPVLRRAACWVLNDYSRYSSVTTTLQQLYWPTLDARRKKARLYLLYKAKNNLTALRIPSYYKIHHNETRLHHQSSFTYILISEHLHTWTVSIVKQLNGTPYQQMSHPIHLQHFKVTFNYLNCKSYWFFSYQLCCFTSNYNK